MIYLVGRALMARGNNPKPGRRLLNGILRLLMDLNWDTIGAEPAVMTMLRLCSEAAQEGQLTCDAFPSGVIRTRLHHLLSCCGNTPMH